MKRYAIAIFLSAFLLFQVQPMLGKYILPWFGGGPAVWTTCMLFFQALLLGGYTYAHLVNARLSLRNQAIAHLVLLGVSLVFLPITPAQALKPTSEVAPTIGILVLLLMTVGLPYLLVSSSAPLLQRWFSLELPGASPYRLYALSNLGSLLGLLTYPFMLERLLGLEAQTWLWSAGYAAFVILTGWCAYRHLKHGATASSDSPIAPFVEDAEAAGAETPSAVTQLLWVSLSAAGSMILLASTNQMTQNIAPIPFLWIVPLALYLTSFIICFDKEQWYDRRIWIPVFYLAVVSVLILLFKGNLVYLVAQLTVYSVVLFACCMVCHGELVRLKPHPRFLTRFYLYVSLGGAIGGLFTTLVAPRVFDNFWEYQLGLMAAFVIVKVSLFYDRSSPLHRGGKPLVWAGFVAAGVALAVTLSVQIDDQRGTTIATDRNFYGVLRVKERSKDKPEWRRYLYHGLIRHGGQLLQPERRREALTYYAPPSGLGRAIDYLIARSERVARTHGTVPAGLHLGMVGLGAGTMATYGREVDRVRFYEINQMVVDFSKEFFTYLEDSPAEVTIVMGDARISFERELAEGRPQQFDLLALDAFTGDTIPMHLLTREAFDVYARHLKPDGLLLIHISADHLDLSPVARGLSEAAGFDALRFINDDNRKRHIMWSEWVTATRNGDYLRDPEVREWVIPWNGPESENIIWTDDYSNLFEVLK